MHHLIIGNSAAGLFAAEEIRRWDKESRITLLTKELYPSYSRCLTSYYLAGEIPQSQLFLREPEFWSSMNFHQEFLAEVTDFKPAWKKVIIRDGREWSYDRLLIATGASPVRLEIPGGDLPQVFTLRTIEDAFRIEESLDPGKRAVLIGGGLVSLKTAVALLKRGLKVTVVVSSSRILSQMLDSTSAQLLGKHLEEHGLQIILNSEVKAILGRDFVQGVELSDNRILWADLVLVGKGVKPNLEPFVKSGLHRNKGILVNSFQETSIPDVFAAGDVAETWDCVRGCPRVNATWPNATLQGKIAGSNMTGHQERYLGSLSLNSVDFFGLSAISAGIIEPDLNSSLEPRWHIKEGLKYRPGDKPVFERLVFQGDILKGYVLVGETSQAGILTNALKTGQPVRITSSHRKSILTVQPK